MLIPPEPRLDLPFVSMTVCAFVLGATSCWYYYKARKYKEALDALTKQLHSFTNKAIKPTNSNTATKRQPNQL